MVQDTWNEQIVKRGWSDWWMPSAVHPGVTPIWGVVLAVTVGGYAAATWEARR